MRNNRKTEVAQISAGVAREIFTHSNLLTEVAREVHTRLPETVRRYAEVALPELAAAAITAAAPQPAELAERLRGDLLRAFDADARDLVARAAGGLLPELAANAVREAAPDPGGVRAALVEAATAELSGTIRAEIEQALESVVTRGSEQVRAAATDAVGKAAQPAAQAVLGEVTAAADGIREDVVRHARERATEAVDRETAKALPAMTDAATKNVLDQVRESVEQAQKEASAAIGKAVGEAVDAKLAEFTPNLVEVVLPTGRRVELGADAHEVLPELLIALHARCHVLLVGPAGTGKSMLAKHAAGALDLPFQALSLGPTTPMSKVFGYYDAHGQYHDTPFRRAFEHGGVMLLDELDNGHPGLLAELNQALALGTCAFADGMVDAHEDFRLVATGNTYGTGADRQYVGRQTLDSATLDRFVVIDVPIDEALEERITLRHTPSHPDEARELLTRIRELRKTAAEKNLPVILSPRASIDGAKLLEAGATVEQVMRWRVVRGLSAAHVKALGLE